MADKNRNRQDPFRSQNDWNEERQRRHYRDEPNYSSSENRGYGNSGSTRNSGMQGDSGWDNRNERQFNSSRQGEFGGNEATGWQSDYDKGYGMSGHGSSGYSDFGGDYGSRGGSRNLYDRDNEGSNRGSYQNQENRLGAGNYGSYGDRGRYDQGQKQYRGGGSNYGGSQYSGSYGESGNGDRGFGQGDSNERSWWDRTTDKVSSWFGDDDAERRRDKDRTQSGQYKGKGPKNYSRSDDRIKEDINDRLSDDPFVDASEVDVTVNGGEVTLTGTVDDRSNKRRAEDIAEAVSGVKNVENRIRVGQTSMQSSGASGSSSMNSPSGSSSMSNPSASSSMSNPSGSSSTQSSSAVPGSSRQKENSYTNSK